MYSINIEKATLTNKNYRKVLFTSKKQQLVVMSIKAGMDIPLEMHKNGDQFIRIEKGKGVARSYIKGKLVKTVKLVDGVSIIIPRGTWHYIKNTGKTPLKLYSIYSPPQHKDGLIQEEKVVE